jgi:hypothetical protein
MVKGLGFRAKGLLGFMVQGSGHRFWIRFRI